jgi:putative ABC transport system permease protein
MFLRLVYLSLMRQRRRKVLAGTSIMLGMALVTAMLAIGSDVQNKMNEEIRSTAGANLIIYPQEEDLDLRVGSVGLKPVSTGAYLKEADLMNIKHIFWSHNILGYTPVLDTTGRLDSGASVAILGTYFHKAIELKYETFYTGIFKTHPWWKVQGSWPADEGSYEAAVGSWLAKDLKIEIGQFLTVSGLRVKITGIADTGDENDSSLIVPLWLGQKIAGRAGEVQRVYVSALTKPEDDFARRDPKTMSPSMLERWSCTPYANSIAYQLSEAIPGAKAEQIRRISQSEGRLLDRISGLMWLIAIASLLAVIMAVSSALGTSMLERRREVGLMKSLGAGHGTIAWLYMAEGTVLALLAGIAGFLLGQPLASYIGQLVFHTPLSVDVVLLPLILMLAVIVTLAASSMSLLTAIKLDPAHVLRGDAL